MLIKDLNIKLVPYGKDNPYVHLSWDNGNNEIKQFYGKGWSKEKMQDFIKEINQIKSEIKYLKK